MSPSASRFSVSNEAAAYALLRFTLGLNILMHGVVRLAMGPSVFAATLEKGFTETPLPLPLVHAFAWLLPFFETLAGALLMVGGWTRAALLGGGVLMAALVFGTALRSQWDTLGLQMIYVALYSALLAAERFNTLSVDGWRARGTSPGTPRAP
ncbi:MauE/DoxX family redox-associated membrane protein [Stigmatella erecta]|nr:MauE/DoxX family redox-associated membrane protein [Stigmatella erecta]